MKGTTSAVAVASLLLIAQAYAQQTPPADPHTSPSDHNQYYCRSLRLDYPYTETCPEPWVTVDSADNSGEYHPLISCGSAGCFPTEDSDASRAAAARANAENAREAGAQTQPAPGAAKGPDTAPPYSPIQQAQTLAQQKIRNYCATATPPYCVEYQREILGGMQVCIRARGDAAAIFSEIKPPISFPPQLVLHNMLDGEFPQSSLAMEDYTPGLSADDLAEIIRLAVASSPSETSHHFVEDIYDRCLSNLGLD